jgi:predicted XRE-type DNA-binding protein
VSKKPLEVTEGSGNVFADLGFPDPEKTQAKARLASRIVDIVEQRGLTQTEASELLGIDQPQVSKLLRGHLSGFSADRLLRFLMALDQDVEIVIRPKPEFHAHGQINVTAAE